MRSNWFFIIAIIITAQALLSMVLPAYSMTTTYGTSTSDNWINAMKWFREETPECTVVATWWDPGHLITQLGERKVTNDGATQIGRVAQEIGRTLLTENETEALSILKNYLGNCSDMYYIASSDLIGKSTAWSYLATWDPETRTGRPSSYAIASVEDPNTNPPRIIQGQNAIAYKYPLGDGNAFVLIENQTSLRPFLLQMGNYYEIKNLAIFYNNTVLETKNPDAPIEGTLWVSPPVSYGQAHLYPEVVYMPPELDHSMFTEMYFYSGVNLKHFKLVENFGNEVKIFKVDFEGISSS